MGLTIAVWDQEALKSQDFVRIDVAVRTATGEEVSNSAFGTGFVANLQ